MGLGKVKRPNTFIIGAPKSGTTALANYLSHHPNAFLCYPKEPSYWSSDINQKHANALIESLGDYEALFKNANEENTLESIHSSLQEHIKNKLFDHGCSNIEEKLNNFIQTDLYVNAAGLNYWLSKNHSNQRIK